ncbi:MAG: Ferredoxin--NADP reductase [Nocardioides sp.]|nr:Ferredoxin--NADP reductase [Nocardioides sp.]
MSVTVAVDATSNATQPRDSVTDVDVDVLVVGAGPSGLYAAYYAGFRGLSCALVDALPDAGGQITALYPEKLIFDVAGFPGIRGKDLVSGLVAQAAPFSPRYVLGEQATSYALVDNVVVIGTSKGRLLRAKAVVVTGGIGTFNPRPLPGGAQWEGRGLDYIVSTYAPYAGKDVVVVGGGDSAVDWALGLEPVAASVTLVHRRDTFRAHAHSVKLLRDSTVILCTPAQVVGLSGGEHLEHVEVRDLDTKHVHSLPAQAVVAALGFTADITPLEAWGLDVRDRHIVVDTTMRTNLPRVFAAGDITDYPGKVRLISVGFGEAATAVCNAATIVDPHAEIFPGHSTEGAAT